MNSASAEAQREPDSSTADDDRPPATAAHDPEAALKDGLDVAYGFLKRQIAERPMTVIATALGAGLLLGAILTDRR